LRDLTANTMSASNSADDTAPVSRL
jgi:hypothetical protein